MNFVSKVLSVVVFLLLVSLSADVLAQPGGPGNPAGGHDPDRVPITGIEFLLVSGGLLGGYKLLKRKPAEE
jgi:hypothetical protein